MFKKPPKNPQGQNVDELVRKLRELSIEKESATQKLYEKIRQHNAIYEIIARITRTLDLESVFELTVKRTKEELHAEVGFLMLTQDGFLEVQYSDGLSDMAKEVFRSKVGAEPFGKLLTNGDTLRIARTEGEHPVFDSLIGLSSYDRTRDLLVVPLRISSSGHLPRGVLGVANSLQRKGFTEEQLETLLIIAGQATIALENAELVDQQRMFFKEMIGALAAAINSKHKYTHVMHSKSVAKWATDIARQCGLSFSEIEKIEIAALLHDVGKIAIPDSILTKQGDLTEDETAVMNQHPEKGAEMLQGLSMVKDIIPLIQAHHEHWDGKGYPNKLSGNQIPLGAQIVALADAFDAMVANRPYHKGISFDEAVLEIGRASGTQFNPKLVDAFLAVVGKHKNRPSEHSKPKTIELE